MHMSVKEKAQSSECKEEREKGPNSFGELSNTKIFVDAYLEKLTSDRLAFADHEKNKLTFEVEMNIRAVRGERFFRIGFAIGEKSRLLWLLHVQRLATADK